MRSHFIHALCLSAVVFACTQPCMAARARANRGDYKAHDTLSRGVDLLNQQQEERGLKLVQSVIKNHPKSPVRFEAHIILGEHHRKARGYDLAVKQFLAASKAEDKEVVANALYQAGICYYHLNRFDRAFVTLRRVTSDYPWSIYANEAYYYIGLSHFKLKRWSKAFEALELVGTSVSPEGEDTVLAEAGQRLFVKVEDLDLAIAMEKGLKTPVQLEVSSGDIETVELQPLGRSSNVHAASIRMVPGKPALKDGTLQTVGGDSVTVTYVDEQTEDGVKGRKVISKVRLVSSAAVGFVDGAYQAYRKGLFGGQEAFMRVRDLDMDTSDAPDTVRVQVVVRYKKERTEEVEKAGVVLEEQVEDYVTRSSTRVTLKETGPHTGIFVGSLPLYIASPGQRIPETGEAIWAMRDDEALMRYVDNEHIGGTEPRTIEYTSRILLGDIQDVRIEHRQVSAVELKARKNLIEAKLLLKLAQIFKDVGLTKKAFEKADEALARSERVISIGLRASLDRSIVEQAYNVKWNLLLVKDNLSGAIGVCRSLIRMFPDSSLVDRALMEIAMAKANSGDPKEMSAASRILRSIQDLPKSDLKAEAQFRAAEIEEKRALLSKKPNLTRAMLMYRECANKFPESLYAGRSLDKISNYYITVAKDYRRAMELFEQVFQDYPDASFLDEMLYKWVVAAYKAGDLELAAQKCDQLLAEYPGSEAATKALAFREKMKPKKPE